MNTLKRPARGMGRKPVNIGHYGTQDAIWRAIRELEAFTCEQLICHVSKDVAVNDHTVKSYLDRLVNADYLSIKKVPKHRGVCVEATYTLIKNTGVETPRLRKDGGKVTQGIGRECMWRSMKTLGEFDWLELVSVINADGYLVSEASAKEYCKVLALAKYLVVVRQGRGTIRSRYRLLPSKWTGPRPPQIQRTKSLFDANLNKVVWQRGPRGGDV
jgi:hypothetical protein